MGERTVDVLLERGGGEDRILTYLVPEPFQDLMQPGVRVAVPVGRRKEAGLVLALDPPHPGTPLRPLGAVLESRPILDAARIDLADWLSARYLGRRCDAWRLFLPPGTARRGARRLVPAVRREDMERRLARFILPAADAALLERAISSLGRRGAVPERLRRVLGPLYRQVEELLGEGYLAWREPWQGSGPGPRRTAHVRLAGGAGAGLTPKQEQVRLYLLSREGRTATRSEIMSACGVGAGVIARMAALGHLVVEEKEVRRIPAERRDGKAGPAPVLYPAQEEAVAWIRARLGVGGRMLLHGVTGSGKTEVYLRALAAAVDAGRTGLLLVPEIGLTPQTVERVTARFGDRVAVLHSRLGVGERRDEWERIREGGADVVVGPRSALFAPLGNLGVVVLDEEHDQAYKQEEGLRYHAREAAAELARRTGAVLVLGSATPSLEAMVACERGEASYFRLPARPGGRMLPPVELIDLRQELRAGRTGALSRRLREALAEALARGEQAILLLNRRGYATFVICRECGHVMRCPHCDVSLTYHQSQQFLLCHYCGHAGPVPDTCPNCRGRYIRYFGQGTERLCEEVGRLFPTARVARMDQDATAQKNAHLELYRALRAGKIDILIGTQMVAKGLDLPGVTLVGVVAADASLNRPDFRAAERTFQLLIQVAGRAGRGEAPGRVFLQTYNPGHYSLACAASYDYEGFYQREKEFRLAGRYPPYTELVRIGLSGMDEEGTRRAADLLAGAVRAALGGAAEVLGPTSALVRRVENRYRYHMLIKADDLRAVGPAIEGELHGFRASPAGRRVAVVVDVNPNTVL